MIRSPLSHPIIQKLKHDAAILKLASELIAVHEKFTSKLDDVNAAIHKKVGPPGPPGPRSMVPGPRGNPGKDGSTFDFDTVIRTVLSKVKLPEDGKPGDPGKDAVITETHLEKIAEKAAKKIKIPEVKQVDALSVIDEIMKMPDGKKLSPKHIDGLEQTLSAFRSQLARGYLHGGGDTVLAGTNITITKNTNGAKIINASGGAFPQMTTAQRLASSPINGSTAYDTDLNVAMIYANGNWGTVLLN